MPISNPEIPIINVGKYRGTPIEQLPNSYLRWMLGQRFPKEWLEIAKRKVDASPYSDDPMMVSRHALDQFSIRFLNHWQSYKNLALSEKYDGMATYLAKLARNAWVFGEDVSKNRHQDDGIVKKHRVFHEELLFVFNQNPDFPEYVELITVM